MGRVSRILELITIPSGPTRAERAAIEFILKSALGQGSGRSSHEDQGEGGDEPAKDGSIVHYGHVCGLSCSIC